MQLEGFGHLKNLVTSSEIERATCLLAAQCLSQLCYRVPQS
jgi:hypothetical protein